MALALVTLAIGWWVTNKLSARLGKLVGMRNPDPALQSFISTIANIVLKILLAISVASMIGIETTSFVAAIGGSALAIGLALHGSLANFAGGVLILLFRPFRIGDWLDTAAAKGRVVEVNWRAVHIDTGNGIQVVPNAMLATGSFTNLSRAQGAVYQAAATLSFGADDKPGAVAEALLSVAAGLPTRLPKSSAKVVALRPVVGAHAWLLTGIAVLNVVLGVAVYLRWAVRLVAATGERDTTGERLLEPVGALTAGAHPAAPAAS